LNDIISSKDKNVDDNVVNDSMNDDDDEYQDLFDDSEKIKKNNEINVEDLFFDLSDPKVINKIPKNISRGPTKKKNDDFDLIERPYEKEKKPVIVREKNYVRINENVNKNENNDVSVKKSEQLNLDLDDNLTGDRGFFLLGQPFDSNGENKKELKLDDKKLTGKKRGQSGDYYILQKKRKIEKLKQLNDEKSESIKDMAEGIKKKKH